MKLQQRGARHSSKHGGVRAGGVAKSRVDADVEGMVELVPG